MKALKITGLFIGVLLLLIIVVSLFLPAKKVVTRSIEINAKPKHIFSLINNLQNWKTWSPWYKKDTTTAYTYNDIPEGAGAKMTWDSKHEEVGKGTMRIIQSTPFEIIETHLDMGYGPTLGRFTIEPIAENNYKLNWSFINNTDSLPFYWVPMSRILNFFMDGFIAKDFDEGLAAIKKLAEAEVDLMIGGFEAEIREFSGLEYIGIRNQIKEEDIGPTLIYNYAQLQETITNQAAKQSGPPFTINYSAKNKVYDMETCMGVNTALSTTAPIVPGKLEACKHLVIKYIGAYDKMGPVYSAGFSYVVQNQLQASGPPIEFYITDPEIEKDTAKWQTELVFPFKD